VARESTLKKMERTMGGKAVML